MRYEICAGSLQSALAAQAAGAHRVELCSALCIGGITPSYGLIRRVRKELKIEVNVLIRPRQGDFLYTPEEVEIMIENIWDCARAGVDGVVIGALDKDGDIDMENTRRMISTARQLGLTITFHRAIDRAKDIMDAMEKIISMGADRILTSGGQPTALEGLETITRMNRAAAGRIIIMPASGINPSNIKEIATASGVEEIHFSGQEQFPSPMVYRGGVTFTPDCLGGDFTRFESSQEKIERTIAAAEGNPIPSASCI